LGKLKPAQAGFVCIAAVSTAQFFILSYIHYIQDKANGIRVYTNEVRLRGLGKIGKIETRAGGFCLYSGDFNRQARLV